MFLLRFSKSVVFVYSLLLLSGIVSAQTNQPAEAALANKLVKWTMLSGTDSELFFAIPENSVIHTNGDYYLGSIRARVDSVKTMVKDIRSAVVQVDLYNGASTEVLDTLLKDFRGDDNRGAVITEGEKGDFHTAEVFYKGADLYLRKQFYRRQDRLYVFSAAARDPENSLLKEFFQCLMLVSEGNVILPNLNDKTVPAFGAKMLLPRPFIEKIGNPATAEIVDEGSLTKPAYVVFQPTPAIPPMDNKFDRTFNQLKVKVLLLANGKVGAVEAITKTTSAIEKEVLDAAKEIKFLPAEKDGKTVSTYRTVQYSLAI